MSLGTIIEFARPALVNKQLTKKQKEVAIRIAGGELNKQSASSIGKSLKTVESHRTIIYKKLGINNTATLTHYVLHQGWIKNIYAK